MGTVFQVTEDKTELSRRVGVVCMTDLNRLEEVFIVTGGKDWESGEAWLELERIRGEQGAKEGKENGRGEER